MLRLLLADRSRRKEIRKQPPFLPQKKLVYQQLILAIDGKRRGKQNLAVNEN
jgi:hypothetical protein